MENAYSSLVGARVSLESAKIAVKRDEINLGYTKVTSPIDGIIIKQEVSDGQTLASNFQTPNLFIIAKDMSVMKIDMNVPESDISKIHVGMLVEFSVDAFQDRSFTGAVGVIDLNPNNQSGVVTYNVVVKLENKDRALFPGMTANITIVLSEVKDALRVPAASLRFTPEVVPINPLLGFFTGQSETTEDAGAAGQGVYLLRNSALIFVPLSVGASDDFYVEVKGGEVKEGDVVVMPTQLSGGQQQRIAIARALAGNPKLLLADEPTGNLDSKTSKEIMQLFSELNESGITIVLITHEQDVARYSERLVQIKDGEIIYDGPMY